MSSAGRKVTTDPSSTSHPIHEGAGLVTSDSLAAESLSHNGAFAAGNPSAAASKQPSASTTSNTTDVRNATTIPAARDHASRPADQDESQADVLARGREEAEPYSNGKSDAVTAAGQRRSERIQSQRDQDSADKGRHTQPSHAGSSSSSKNKTSKTTADADTTTSSTDPDSYAGVAAAKRDSAQRDNPPNASYSTDIGGKGDPSRVAEREFAKRNAQDPSAPSGAGRSGGEQQQGDGSAFEVLEERSA